MARGEFLETNEFDGNLYGSSRIVLEDMLRKVDTVFAILDVNGARKALHAFPEATSVFIRPQSIADLRKRHEGRGMPPADVAWRIERAREEIACAHEFGSVITNREGKLEDALADMRAVVEGRA
jgi:guanylate kinase